MKLVHAAQRLFTVDEFTRLYETGAFGHERLELIEGVIVRMSPQGDSHAQAILHATERLVLAFHDSHWVGVQVPLRLSEYSGPEPDFYLSPKGKEQPRVISAEALRMADLVIEVAVSSLAYDRDEKASLYARYGIREYWVLDAVGRKLEVHRGPEPMEGRTFGHGYADVRACEEVDRVSPLCRPDVSIAATELL